MQTSISEVISNEKPSTQQKKQSTKLKGNVWNERKYLQVIHPIKS